MRNLQVFILLAFVAVLDASTIYVLKATFLDRAARYYVGKTDDLDQRLQAHKTTDKPWLHGANDISVQWTGKDTDICKFDPTQAEETVFMLVVRQFGHIETDIGLNVRGASYTLHALELCFNCGSPFHYANANCRHKTLELNNKFLDDIRTHDEWAEIHRWLDELRRGKWP